MAEAVPLGTVYLQRLLEREGVRSLAIKGPSFVELGVRAKRQSIDIDMVVHPHDRRTATAALERAGWKSVSGPIPVQLEQIKYSTTLSHDVFPVTVDLHHLIPGLLTWPTAFEALWKERSLVTVAHHPVTTVSQTHALILESLNAMKGRHPGTWESSCQRVVEHVANIDSRSVAAAVVVLGASHTAAPLLNVIGEQEPASEPPPGYRRWAQSHRRGGFEALRYAWTHAPHLVLRLMWHRVVLDEASARYWSARMKVPFRGRWDVFRLRVKHAQRMLMKSWPDR